VNHPTVYPLQKIDGRFLCADNTRFWCMFAVVAVHCTRVFTLSASDDSWAVYVAATVFKFATIGFFLVSGFLLEKGLATDRPLELLSKRMRKVFLPWLFWCVLFAIVLGLSDFAQHRTPFLPGVAVFRASIAEADRVLTSTALWFVPNILFSLSVLLVFRRYLQRLGFGAVLLAADLFYTVNIYAQWIPASHPRALFAFIFYLWLGYFAAIHLEGFKRTLGRVSSVALVCVTLLAASLSFAEARLLYHLHSSDPLNTLRLSNQIFSVLVVLCLCKVRRATWPRFVDVSRHTFGIYLSHALIVGIVLTTVRRLLELSAFAPIVSSVGLRVLLWGVATLIAWTAGFLISREMAATPSLCWLVGLSPRQTRPETEFLTTPRPSPSRPIRSESLQH
jgi:acyltransferase